jgi:hypothetical protein
MKKIVLSLIACLVLICSCTENEMAKNYGGKMTINLPKGRKLVNITWKDSDAWYLTKSMGLNDSAETYTFNEESAYGIWEGTIKIIESK